MMTYTHTYKYPFTWSHPQGPPGKATGSFTAAPLPVSTVSNEERVGGAVTQPLLAYKLVKHLKGRTCTGAKGGGGHSRDICKVSKVTFISPSPVTHLVPFP